MTLGEIITWALLSVLFLSFAAVNIYLWMHGFAPGLGYAAGLLAGFLLYIGIFLIAPNLVKSTS